MSKPFVEKVLRQYRETGRLEPERRRPGRHLLIDALAWENVLGWPDAQSDLNLAELAARLDTGFELQVSISSVWCLLKRLGMRRKKTVHAAERNTAQVLLADQQYRAQLAGCQPINLKFIDESGCNITMTRRYGRPPQGARARCFTQEQWANVAILGALSCDGLNPVMKVDGATDTAVFRAYVTQVLAPTLVQMTSSSWTT